MFILYSLQVWTLSFILSMRSSDMIIYIVLKHPSYLCLYMHLDHGYDILHVQYVFPCLYIHGSWGMLALVQHKEDEGVYMRSSLLAVERDVSRFLIIVILSVTCYIYIRTYIHTNIHTSCIHICIHTYIRKYIHTYIHTYLNTCICTGRERWRH